MTKSSERRVLVILSSRFAPTKPARFIELECETDGTITKEKTLRGEPKEAGYDEVWINDEGKEAMSDCNRFKRVYRHPLEKR